MNALVKDTRIYTSVLHVSMFRQMCTKTDVGCSRIEMQLGSLGVHEQNGGDYGGTVRPRAGQDWTGTRIDGRFHA